MLLLQGLMVVSIIVVTTCIIVGAAIISVAHLGGDKAIRILQALGLAPMPKENERSLEQISLKAQKTRWRGK